ncbi:hypothetical protein TTHERM_01141510 (macronuclear) [Tetrahymena thermophila SB210]|uniref:Uncharacterized protein n=1 Tax=Tetrahymena thermophila (strain SB210) TaxID=312017 RepID=Q22AZ8_TETTS|nr:hypothetical protein TTHERM_01141510 [Tetrahymena thermophila SB210]EAR82460.2 hypothetical protein TTHERM_01141510 [Tetrahymena thermophila SB210]|eukprot:XP_001030123.2 hypothetical protein TTHERM_01141510 [Tetrahymena thermophila SB210]
MGRKLEVRAQENIYIVRQCIEEDLHLFLKALIKITEIQQSRIQTMLNEDLDKKSIMTKWVTYHFNENNIQNKIQQTQIILNTIQENIFAIDGKWIYMDPLSPKQNQQQSVDKNNKNFVQQTIFKRIITAKKHLLILAMTYYGEYFYFILDQYLTIDSERIQYIPQHPYSPDIDRFIFRNLEFERRNITFIDKAHIFQYVSEVLEEHNNDKLQKELKFFLGRPVQTKMIKNL